MNHALQSAKKDGLQVEGSASQLDWTLYDVHRPITTRCSDSTSKS